MLYNGKIVKSGTKALAFELEEKGYDWLKSKRNWWKGSMSEILDIKKWYISNFEKFENNLNGGSLKPIHQVRKEAIAKFSTLNFPTTLDEDWRFTNIMPLLKHNFLPSGKINLKQKQIKNFLFKKISGNLIVFVNGHFAPELSKLKNLPEGISVGSLSDLIKSGSAIVNEHFGKYANFKTQIFTAS